MSNSDWQPDSRFVTRSVQVNEIGYSHRNNRPHMSRDVIRMPTQLKPDIRGDQSLRIPLPAHLPERRTKKQAEQLWQIQARRAPKVKEYLDSLPKQSWEQKKVVAAPPVQGVAGRFMRKPKAKIRSLSLVPMFGEHTVSSSEGVYGSNQQR